MKVLENIQTGIASEFYVAGELSRLGYDVTITFGNTKSIDLLIHKDLKVYKVQVKGMQYSKSGNWNLNISKINEEDNLFFILTNLHVNDKKAKPEFFILTTKEALNLFVTKTKDGKSLEGRGYLSYSKIKSLDIYQDRWEIFDK